jgi:hypothetical protein
MSKGAAFDATTVAVATVVPATAMVAAGHTWVAAVTIGAVLASVLVLARIRARAATEQHRETLSYAHTATSLGADPSSVIKAMQGGEDEDVDLRAGRDGDDPGNGGDPQVHLPPRRRR